MHLILYFIASVYLFFLNLKKNQMGRQFSLLNAFNFQFLAILRFFFEESIWMNIQTDKIIQKYVDILKIKNQITIRLQ